MSTVNVRYIVHDVKASVGFYTNHLGFDVVMNLGTGFVMLSRGNLRLLLNAPGTGAAGQAMPDGTQPIPGGWNRIQIHVDDLDAFVSVLQSAQVQFRNEIVTGIGGRQILIEDPSGNCIELFEPYKRT